MNDLRELMGEAVRDADPRLDRIAVNARARGTTIRRRRRAGVVLGSAAAVAAVVGLTTLIPGNEPLGGANDKAGEAAVASSPKPETTAEADPMVPMDGRSIAAALIEVAAAEVPGEPRRVDGQGDEVGAYAGMRWAPADGTAATWLQINVMPDFVARGADVSINVEEFYSCARVTEPCTVKKGTDGSTLMVYDNDDSPDGVMSTADYLRADGVRILISSANSLRPEKTRAVRKVPPFDREQLVSMAQSKLWGVQLPARYEAAGAKLDYTELDGS